MAAIRFTPAALLAAAGFGLALSGSAQAQSGPLIAGNGTVTVNLQALDNLGPGTPAGAVPTFAAPVNIPTTAASGFSGGNGSVVTNLATLSAPAAAPLLGDSGSGSEKGAVKLRPPRAAKSAGATPAGPRKAAVPASVAAAMPSATPAPAAPAAVINLPPPQAPSPTPVAPRPLQLPSSEPPSATAPAVAAAPPPIAAPAPAPVARVTPPPPSASAAIASGMVSLAFEAGKSDLPANLMPLDQLAQQLASGEDRLQIRAYASASGADAASGARRLSLSRALAVRGYLIDKGIRSTRIDVRALGTPTDGSAPDRVEVAAAGR